jgi:hypothetical protein
MKNPDLEKIIILLCLLGMPITGGWIYKMRSELDEAQKAFKTLPTIIQRIHGLHDLIDKTNNEVKEAGDLDKPDIYFENRAMISQAGSQGRLQREDIRISEASSRPVRRDGSGPVIGQDIEIKVELGIAKGRRGMTLPRDFINAFIVNCEAKTPIWRLRNLRLTNKAFKGLGNTKAPADLELLDEWIVDELMFARRKPIVAKKK